MNPTIIYLIAILRKGLTNKLYRIARNAMLRRKRNLIYRATGLRTGTILDIGSGTGYFAETMKEAGWKVKGIEISEKARKFSNAHFGVDIISRMKFQHLVQRVLIA